MAPSGVRRCLPWEMLARLMAGVFGRWLGRRGSCRILRLRSVLVRAAATGLRPGRTSPVTPRPCWRGSVRRAAAGPAAAGGGVGLGAASRQALALYPPFATSLAKCFDYGCFNGNVSALNATTRRIRWTYATMACVVGSPVIAGGTVCIGSIDGNVYALNAATGWRRFDAVDQGLQHWHLWASGRSRERGADAAYSGMKMAVMPAQSASNL